MGMGGSTSWPASNRIIREWFPASERALANAIFGAVATLTMTLTMTLKPIMPGLLAGAAPA